MALSSVDRLQFIGSDTPDGVGSCYLLCSTFTATQGSSSSINRRESYGLLFNCPEGAQRFCTETTKIRDAADAGNSGSFADGLSPSNKSRKRTQKGPISAKVFSGSLKIKRTRMTVFTRLCIDTVMGLPGCLLTLEDVINGSLAGTKGDSPTSEYILSPTSQSAGRESLSSPLPDNVSEKEFGRSKQQDFLLIYGGGTRQLLNVWRVIHESYFRYRPPCNKLRIGVKPVAKFEKDSIPLGGLLFAFTLNQEFLSDSYSIECSNFRPESATASISSPYKRNRSTSPANDSVGRTKACNCPEGECPFRKMGYSARICAFKTGRNHSEDICGYLVLHSVPLPRFDVSVAREIYGIAPGVKYSILKDSYLATLGGEDMPVCSADASDCIDIHDSARPGAVESDLYKGCFFTFEDMLERRFISKINEMATAKGLPNHCEDDLCASQLFVKSSNATLVLDFNTVAEGIEAVHTVMQHSFEGSGKFTFTNVIVLAPLNKISANEGVLKSEIEGEITRGLYELSAKYQPGSSMQVLYYPTPCASGHFIDPLSQCTGFPTAMMHKFHMNMLLKQNFPYSASVVKEDIALDSVYKKLCDICKSEGESVAMRRLFWPFSFAYGIDDVACLNSPIPPPGGLESVLLSVENEQTVTARSRRLREIINAIYESNPGLVRLPTFFGSKDVLSSAFSDLVAAEVLPLVNDQPTSFDVENSFLFLGTGSAIPSKYRNVSGLVVGNIPHVSVAAQVPAALAAFRIICDFGEGSIGQWDQCLMQGTFDPNGQLEPLFSNKDVLTPLEQLLLTIRIVFLSHSHADHVLGVPAFFEMRLKSAEKVRRIIATEAVHPVAPILSHLLTLANTAVYIACPRSVREFFFSLMPLISECWVKKYPVNYALPPPELSKFYVMSINNQFVFIDTNVLSQRRSIPNLSEPLEHDDDYMSAVSDAPPRELPVLNWLMHYLFSAAAGAHAAACVVPVDHPANAHALFVRTPSWSWCFSGDTRPVGAIPRIATAASREEEFQTGTPPEKIGFAPLDVLIHESTFEDIGLLEAQRKKHSCCSEAIKVGEDCRARWTILNHFSQRYPKMMLPEELKMVFRREQDSWSEMKLIISFDGFQISYRRGVSPPKLPIQLLEKLLSEYEGGKDN